MGATPRNVLALSDAITIPSLIFTETMTVTDRSFRAKLGLCSGQNWAFN